MKGMKSKLSKLSTMSPTRTNTTKKTVASRPASKRSDGRAAAATPRAGVGRTRPSGVAPARKSPARPFVKSVAKPTTKRQPARRASGPGAAAAIFSEAVQRAMQGYGFDAIALFRDAIDANPAGELADDALFNIGAAYLQMRLVKDAEDAFTELIAKYPDATIAAVHNGNEHGRTAAKALLGRMQARYAAGDFAGAESDRAALAAYDDSWVTDPHGDRKTFRELAAAVMP